MEVLVTINGHPVGTADALGWSALLDGPNLRDFVSEQVTVAQAARARGLEADDDEVEELFVEMRRMKRLDTGEALKRWMSETGLSVNAMIDACTNLVLRRKLRESISETDISGHYAEHRPDFDRATLYRIAVQDHDVAQELQALVLEEDDSFCLLAMQHSIDDETAPMGGYLGQVGRSDLHGEVEASVFSAVAGDVVGPLKTEIGWELLLIHELLTIPLEEVADEIRDILFDDMIHAAQSRARVE